MATLREVGTPWNVAAASAPMFVALLVAIEWPLAQFPHVSSRPQSILRHDVSVLRPALARLLFGTELVLYFRHVCEFLEGHCNRDCCQYLSNSMGNLTRRMDEANQTLAAIRRLSIRKLALLGYMGVLAQAHIGSPGIYLDGNAGPYKLFITVRPPTVIPGVAELDIRCETPGVRQIRAIPMPMSGDGARFAPIADKLTVSKQDSQFFTGSLWMMVPGSWEVRVSVDGTQGKGVVAVPVPSMAITTKKMQRGLGAVLFILMTFLVLGIVAMVGASVREAKLEPGVEPTRNSGRRGRIAMSIAFVVVIGVIWFGGNWWDNEANSYASRVYKPLQMNARLDGGGRLTLTMSDPGWLKRTRPGRFNHSLFVRTLDDLIPDHNHLMHLYAFRQPGLDVVYHLHPDLIRSGVFGLNLPVMAPGAYNLYADIVHQSGFPETMVAALEIPAGLPGRPLTGDDASGATMPWDRASSSSRMFSLPDGYRMEWLRGNDSLCSGQPMFFRFRLDDLQGRAPTDMTLYMGMLGHAAFVKVDGTVFAHIHPSGSVSMAAFMLAQQTTGVSIAMPAMDHSTIQMVKAIPNEVSFPYAFPTPGRYRIFVQMKHGESIETGIFDADAQ